MSIYRREMFHTQRHFQATTIVSPTVHASILIICSSTFSVKKYSPMSRQNVLQEIYISLLTSYCNLVELNLSQSMLRKSSKSLLRCVIWRFFHYLVVQIDFYSKFLQHVCRCSIKWHAPNPIYVNSKYDSELIYCRRYYLDFELNAWILQFCGEMLVNWPITRN